MGAEQWLVTLPDGTIKQRNPFSWTEVWTLPDRGKRPLTSNLPAPQPITTEHGSHCAFCEDKYLATPPEKSRSQRYSLTDEYQIVPGAKGSQISDPTYPKAAFRRVSNLFEILSYNYWNTNYGYHLTEKAKAAKAAYLAEQEGVDHINAVAQFKMSSIGEELDDTKLEAITNQFFGGGHDLIISQDHFLPDATHTNQLVGSGELSVEAHQSYIHMAVDALRDHYESNPFALYVAVFQNWLKPAGASFDHLHKQVVSIDERGPNMQTAYSRLLNQPNLFNTAAANVAVRKGLVIAENEHALAHAGFGHRYPTVEIYSKSKVTLPWKQSKEEIDGMADIIHACHAATGVDIATNEEWHHQGPDIELPMPWRVNLKWRISTIAGFEGGTKVFINTLSPWDVCERVVTRLHELREEGSIAPMCFGYECDRTLNKLRYNPHLH